jgi:hypothetical protein
MQDPVRAKKADRWDALVAQGMSGSEAQAQVEREFAQKEQPSTPQQAKAQTPETPRDLSLGEQVVGGVREAMNAVTFGQYPKMVGGINRLLGRDDEDAAKLGQYMAEYRQRAPGQAMAARMAGEVVPYLAGGGVAQGAGRVARGVGRMVSPQATSQIGSALSAATAAAKRGYGMARTAPGIGAVGRRVLPAAGAGQTVAIEGARGVLEGPESGEERTLGEVATDVAKRIGGGLLGGKVGEVVGTRVAATVGPTLGKVATKAKEATEKAGEAISAWKGGAPVPLTQGMARLYGASKLLRDAVDAEAENLGLMSNHPMVLARAYGAVSRAVRGTPDAADVQKMVLQPFLKEIDTAAQGPLSPLIRRYAEGKGAEEATQAAQRTVSYLRTGKGDPFRSSPEAMAQWAGRSYRSQAERDAAAQALIASLGMGGTGAGPIWQRAVRPFKGTGDVADLVETIGGRLTFGQRAARFAGQTTGATAGSRSQRRD